MQTFKRQRILNYQAKHYLPKIQVGSSPEVKAEQEMMHFRIFLSVLWLPVLS